MTSEQNVRTQLIDERTQKRLMPRSFANNIIFDDGESLQFKYDNGKLAGDGDILNGLRSVSPEIEVVENSDTSYVLKIESINGVIITPNLRGENGIFVPGGDGSMIAKPTFKLPFASGDFKPGAPGIYYLTISRRTHRLGEEARVVTVLRYINGSDLANVNYTFNRHPNGDIEIISGEPFDGIIYLEGDLIE